MSDLSPALANYAASVKARGGAYIPSLPSNTNLGPSALGKPGARFTDPLGRNGLRYELAHARALADRAQQLDGEDFQAGVYKVANTVSAAAEGVVSRFGTTLALVALVALVAFAVLNFRKVL